MEETATSLLADTYNHTANNNFCLLGRVCMNIPTSQNLITALFPHEYGLNPFFGQPFPSSKDSFQINNHNMP